MTQKQSKKRASSSSKGDLADALGRIGRSVFDHAGSFLMRQVCEEISHTCSTASRELGRLEAENFRLRNEVAELEAYIRENEASEEADQKPLL